MPAELIKTFKDSVIISPQDESQPPESLFVQSKVGSPERPPTVFRTVRVQKAWVDSMATRSGATRQEHSELGKSCTGNKQNAPRQCHIAILDQYFPRAFREHSSSRADNGSGHI